MPPSSTCARWRRKARSTSPPAPRAASACATSAGRRALGRLLELPVIGRVAAGSPILAEEHVQGRYQVDPNLFTPRADYLLRVRGMSMRDAGILEGDLLAVHRTQEARTGQIVVARLADEVTVKRFRRRGHAVQLLPENPGFRADRGRPAPRRAGHRGHRRRRDPQRQESVRPAQTAGLRLGPDIMGQDSRLADESPSTATAPAHAAPPRRRSPRRDRADPRHVLADRVEQLYSQMPLGIVATLRHRRRSPPTSCWDERTARPGAVLVGAGAADHRGARARCLWAYRRSTRQRCRGRAMAALARHRRARQRRQLGLRRRRVLPLAHRRAAGVPRLPARRHDVGRHPGLRRLLADLRALRRRHRRCRSPTCWLRSAIALFVEIALLVPMFYLINVGDRLPPQPGVPFGLPPAPRLRQADRGLHRAQPAAASTSWSSSTRRAGRSRRSGRKLALFAERAPIAVFELDPDGSGDAGRTTPRRLLFGYAASELVGAQRSSGWCGRSSTSSSTATWAKLLASRAADRRHQDPQPAARRHRPYLRVDRDAAGQRAGRPASRSSPRAATSPRSWRPSA